MATHKFIFNLEQGGYFFRIYPKLAPPHIPNWRDQDLFSNLPTGVHNPEPRIQGSVRAQVHGAFQRKFIDRKNHTIELLIEGEITLRDTTLNNKEVRNLFSIIQIHVPQNIYNYDFHEGCVYIITPTEVQPI